MNNSRIHFTKEGFEEIKKSHEELLLERKEAVKVLSEARNMGDLSENGLYTAAKARLRGIDSNLRRLEKQIKLAEIVKPAKDVVGIGNTVTVNDGKENKTFTIVGATEAEPAKNCISENSPIGKALIGKKVGEKAKVITPMGTKTFKLIKLM